MSLPPVLIAIKSAVSFPTDLTLAGHHVWKGQASETLWRNDVLEFSKMCKPPLGRNFFSLSMLRAWAVFNCLIWGFWVMG